MWWKKKLNKKLNKNLQLRLVNGVPNWKKPTESTQKIISELAVKEMSFQMITKIKGMKRAYSAIGHKKDSGLVVSWSLAKKIGESLGLVKLRLARKLQSLDEPLESTNNRFKSSKFFWYCHDEP